MVTGTITLTNDQPLPQGINIRLLFERRGHFYEKREEPNFLGNFQSYYPPDGEFRPVQWFISYPGYWSLQGSLSAGRDLEIKLEPIDMQLKTPHFAWWHEELGLKRYDPTLGKGITVGVVDSGCCRDHLNLQHVVHLGCMDGGEIVELCNEEVHGTHVCGIIGARPMDGNTSELAGIAPGARLLSLQLPSKAALPPHESVFSNFEPVSQIVWDNLDLAEAIHHLAIEKRADIINLSLAGTGNIPSASVENAIREAYEAGTVCVAAAGNNGSEPVSYPAAFKSVVAVSSLGKKKSGPQRDPNPQLPEIPARVYGDWYLARSSSYGERLACCAPGVRITSTAPVSACNGADMRPYWDMTGTSMAAPMVAGALAVRLSKDLRTFRNLTGSRKADYASQLIPNICRDLRLARSFQGEGLVTAV